MHHLCTLCTAPFWCVKAGKQQCRVTAGWDPLQYRLLTFWNITKHKRNHLSSKQLNSVRPFVKTTYMFLKLHIKGRWTQSCWGVNRSLQIHYCWCEERNKTVSNLVHHTWGKISGRIWAGWLKVNGINICQALYFDFFSPNNFLKLCLCV